MKRLRPVLLLVALAGASFPAGGAHPAAHLRCGWLVNETPGNFELIDAAGSWTIAQQGGYQARGFDVMPDMSSAGWVETNGPHGHGCACMSVVTDRKHARIARVRSARPVSLARCTRDRALPRL